METENIVYQVTQEDLLAVVTKAVRDALEKNHHKRYYLCPEVCSVLKITRKQFYQLYGKGVFITAVVGKRHIIDADHVDAMAASGIIKRWL